MSQAVSMLVSESYRLRKACPECGQIAVTRSMEFCPACDTKMELADVPPPRLLSIRQPPMRYQNAYVWLIFISALDIMMTWLILYWGGREVNALADWVIQNYDLAGMIIFKFTVATFVVVLCELVGRMRDSAGRKLAIASVAISALPVFLAFTMLLSHGEAFFMDRIVSSY